MAPARATSCGPSTPSTGPELARQLVLMASDLRKHADGGPCRSDGASGEQPGAERGDRVGRQAVALEVALDRAVLGAESLEDGEHPPPLGDKQRMGGHLGIDATPPGPSPPP